MIVRRAREIRRRFLGRIRVFSKELALCTKDTDSSRPKIACGSGAKEKCVVKRV